MSVKKTRVTKKTKREIKKAVEQIPGLIFEHVRLQNQEEKPKISVEDLYPVDNFVKPEEKQKPTPISYNHAQTQKKKMMMWSGVIILTTVVFAMWFLNAGMTIRDLKEGYTKTVPGITETAKQSWEETKPATTNGQTDSNKPIENLDSLKNQIKNNLISIFYVQQASTTASSTN